MIKCPTQINFEKEKIYILIVLRPWKLNPFHHEIPKLNYIFFPSNGKVINKKRIRIIQIAELILSLYLWGQRNYGPGPGPVYLRFHGPIRGGLLPRTTTCSALHQMPKERNELSVWGRVREKAANTITLSTASYKPILRSLPMRLSSNSQPL